MKMELATRTLFLKRSPAIRSTQPKASLSMPSDVLPTNPKFLHLLPDTKTAFASAALTPFYRRIFPILARIAQRHKLDHDAARLARSLASLSQAYNTEGTARREHLAARLGFSFVRDVPKSLVALAESLPRWALRFASADDSKQAPATNLKIVDVGYGLGATTTGALLGLATMLRIAHAGRSEPPSILRVEVIAYEPDSEVRAVAITLMGELRELWSSQRMQVALNVVSTLEEAKVAAKNAGLILFGQVLSEMHQQDDEEERAAKHATMLRDFVSHEHDPLLLVVEPALRERSRHLHRVRQGLIVGDAHDPKSMARDVGRHLAQHVGQHVGQPGWQLLGPCTHQNTCPMLARESDWCHEDVDLDLPEELVGLARAAGLRFQGLTFSYMLLGRTAETAKSAMPLTSNIRARTVSRVRAQKGKSEVLLCASETLSRVFCLTREESASNQDLRVADRGDLITLPARFVDGGRVHADVLVSRVPWHQVFGDGHSDLLDLLGYRLYPIVDVDLLRARAVDLFDYVAFWVERKPRWLQLRFKSADALACAELAKRVLPLMGETQLIINDFVEVARELSGEASGVGAHVGQGDGDLAAILQAHPSLSLGFSTHTQAELRAACTLSLSYVAFGPIFSTASKADHEKPLGLLELEEARASCADKLAPMFNVEAGSRKLPLVAIGGIDEATLPQVLQYANAVASIGMCLGHYLRVRARSALASVQDECTQHVSTLAESAQSEPQGGASR
jgi:thiamine-phosphate diphosphorylase